MLFSDFITLFSSQERNPRLSSYRDYLQSRYRAQTLKSISEWPPIRAKKVIKLAMIEKEEIQSGRIDDEFVRLTITGKIDDILFRKTPIKLANIFSNIKDRQKLVLFEGAPGSGKSTLALHICQQWAEGKLFQEFDIAILVRLRDPLIRQAKTIADILPCTDQAMATEKESVIKSLYGKGVLWVLDGWDELPSGLPQHSIINKLIQPSMQQESPLHESTVAITSRPSSSAELHQLVSSRIEVLGFTPHQLEQYFTECLKGDLQAVKTLLDRIRENPVVEGSCYLPLNASIVVNCFLLSENHSLPTSNHGIFISVVQSSLKRYLQDRLGKKVTAVGNITSPESLPSELRSPFVQQCQLAYHGIDKNKVTFTDKDLSAASVSKDISDIGLMQTVPSIIGDGHLVYYSFLHLSIQELLAAIHISLMSPKDQISAFRKLFRKPRFSAVFQFYTGITKLRTARSVLSKIPRFLCPIPVSVFDLVKKIVKSECEKYGKPRSLLLSLINCLYEAEDLSLCTFVADILGQDLYLANTTMTPIDCLSVGYFVSGCTKRFLLNVRNCSISDQGCKFLVRGMFKCLHSYLNLQLCLDCNDIHKEGIRHIGELLTSNRIFSLDLSGNGIGSDGLSTLCEALSTNTSLTNLILNNCSLSLDNHRAIPQLLRTNATLQLLDLSFNVIDHTELNNLFESLSINTSLKNLALSNCSLSQIMIPPLPGINTTLKFLDLSGNAAGNTLCDTLLAFTSLEILNLSDCSLEISDVNGAALYQLLINNHSLKQIDLSSNTVVSCHHIAAGLAINKTLKMLYLDHCKLTDRSIKELSTGLINNIERLDIGHNDLLTENGLDTLARHLTKDCPKLKKLWIPERFCSSMKKILKETKEERKKNRLAEIDFHYA